MSWFGVWLLLHILPISQSVIPGSRLLDFPNPDLSRLLNYPDDFSGRSFAEVVHNFASVPFHVRVYAMPKDGNNANFVFEGTGACQNDGRDNAEPASGFIFGYNERSIQVLGPKRHRRVVAVGGIWGYGKYSQTVTKASVIVEAWRTGPLPSFETKIEINTTIKNNFWIPHPLQQQPEMISLRVSDKNGRHSNLNFNGIGASQATSKTRMIGGVLFAYNVSDIIMWTPNRPKTGCIGISKNWGKGKIMVSRNCYVHIRLWVNAFPPPVFQTDWMKISTSERTSPFFEVQHKLRMLPTYVRVQYRLEDRLHPLVFEGSGTVQSVVLGKNRFGGVLFAYDKMSVRVWLPRGTKNGKKLARIIYVGDGWGNMTSPVVRDTAELRVQVFADKCMDKTQVVDAQGYCRDISEVELVQQMGPWGKCSNPCGNGTKSREVKSCTGRSLQAVIDCDFSKDYCGFRRSGFNWTRSADIHLPKTCARSKTDIKLMDRNSRFMSNMISKQGSFIYTDTKPCVDGKWANMHQGRLISEELYNANGCILTFRYTAESYFEKFVFEVQSSDEKVKGWRKLWFMEDGQVRRGVWQSAYIDIGYYVKSIKKLRFVHKLPYSNSETNRKCPEKCHPILLTNITLRCEKDDLHVVNKDTCEEKKLPMTSCLVNAFKPFSKGKAWSVNHAVRNRENENIGSFVETVGSKGDLVATYLFNVNVYSIYHIWFESFAMSNKTNGITVEISDDHKYHEDLVYNQKTSLWLPLIFQLPLQAGRHVIKLYQKEKHFRFRNLMIAPRNISIWGSLGLQSQLIPDNNFMTLSGITTLLGYSRLNGLGGWMPSDTSDGIYLEIQLPELALVNKVATQGGTSLGKHYTCMTKAYKLKFSLDRLSFAYYRKNIKDVNEYVFTGNTGPPKTDYNAIMEHTFSYALVARAVRIYPVNFTYSPCIRVEFYGYYLARGFCPEIVSKTRQKNCTGDGICGVPNMQCRKDPITHNAKCECDSGFHGNACNMTGCDPNPCAHKSTCVVTADTFQCDCQPGFYGRYCDSKCPVGRYGKKCVNICACAQGEHCDPTDGKCSCLPGFNGERCRTPCANGTYGQDCSQRCSCLPPLHCDHVTGECYCSDGFQGDKCDVKCGNNTYGRNCTEKCGCQNGGSCLPDGKCKCLPGWFSDKCEFPCPVGRFGEMCSELCPRHGNSNCDRVTGRITCAKGYHGRFCRKQCAEGRFGEGCIHRCNCVAKNTLNCRKDTGTCVCRPGWRGERCEDKCERTWGEGCKQQCRCKNGGKCDHVTGVCTCRKGHNGTYCEKLCAPGFYGLNCAHRCNCNPRTTDKCDPASGNCSCVSGYTGSRCLEECSRYRWGENCEQKCECMNDATCAPNDGFCFCGKGFTGTRCEQLCKPGTYGRHCANKCLCQNGAQCDRVDGKCSCAAGYQGQYCQHKCTKFWYGSQCKSKCDCVASQTLSCNHINGSCACKAGFKGKDCGQECDDGYYGVGCSKTCQPCRHSYHACNKINGTCSCINGFTGSQCMDDCEISKYGAGCLKKCQCDDEKELCDNVNGTCYDKAQFTFKINLLINLYTFKFKFFNAQEQLKENLALLVYHCLRGGEINLLCSQGNTSIYSLFPQKVWETRAEQMKHAKLLNTFFIRIIDSMSKFSANNEEVTVVTLTLLNNTHPVNGTKMADLISLIPTEALSTALRYPYYKGLTYNKKRTLDPINSKMRYIVIGMSAFGGLLTVFLVCLICRCTTRVPYPPPFQKVRRDSKDFEMEVNMTCNSHLLAFENPYYDIIAAMGLDEDVEEDYYNPLYDNMLELHSDSETEPEDMYYSFRNNNYHRRTQYPYDKDSGFSSGTLM